MLQKTLIAMMCSLSLVACGGGGGGSSSSGSADGGQVTAPASDLDKANNLSKQPMLLFLIMMVFKILLINIKFLHKS